MLIFSTFLWLQLRSWPFLIYEIDCCWAAVQNHPWKISQIVSEIIPNYGTVRIVFSWKWNWSKGRFNFKVLKQYKILTSLELILSYIGKPVFHWIWGKRLVQTELLTAAKTKQLRTLCPQSRKSRNI